MVDENKVVNSANKKCYVLQTNKAAMLRGCKPGIHNWSAHLFYTRVKTSLFYCTSIKQLLEKRITKNRNGGTRTDATFRTSTEVKLLLQDKVKLGLVSNINLNLTKPKKTTDLSRRVTTEAEIPYWWRRVQRKSVLRLAIRASCC